MTVLNDDVWFLILKHSSLNDRTRYRQVSKKWCFLIDKIAVRKLVIFYNLSPSPGHLKLTGEKYSLGDTVQVTDWNRFIQNEFVKHLLKSVEKMAIISTEMKKLSFYELSLNELVHLELVNISIDNGSKLLQSNKIESLYYMDENVYHVDYNRNLIFNNFGFINRLNKLRNLNIKNIISLEFLKDFSESFEKLNVLDVHVKDVACICYINDEFENLSNLNVYLLDKLGTLDPFLTPQIFQILKLGLRPDLKVFLFDMDLDKLDSSFICDYLNQFRNQIEFDKSKMIYYVNEYSSVLFKSSMQHFDPPDVLFKSIDELIFQVPSYNIKIFKQMVNVESIVFTFKKSLRSSMFEKYLKVFKNLKKLELIFEDIVGVYHAKANKVIRLLPTYCPNLHTLRIKNLNNSFKLRPLGMFRSLKFLGLDLRDRISTKLYKRIIRNNRHLVLFEVVYDRKLLKGNEASKEQSKREQHEQNEIRRLNECVRKYATEIRSRARGRLCLARRVRWCLEARSVKMK